MKVALAEVLAMVREELVKANDAAMRSQHPVMVFDECELEFAVDVEFDTEAKAKFLSFISLGGGAKKSDSNTLRVKFKALEGLATVAAGGDRSKPGPAPGTRVPTSTPRKRQR